MAPKNNPAWLYLLNALERDWRTAELLKDRNPDPLIEKHLRYKGVWPEPPDRMSRREIERRAH